MADEDIGRPGMRLFTRQRLLLLAVNFVIYAFLIRWVVRNVGLSQLWDALGQIPAWAILLSFAINFLALVFYGVRMSLLLRRSFGVSFAIINIGYALNTLMPFRLGDAAKMYMCKKLFAIRFSEILSSTIAEKLIDLGKLLLLGGILVAFSANALISANVLMSLTGVVAAGVAGVLLFRIYLARMIRLLPKRGGLRRGIIALHRQIGSYRFAPILATTVVIWSFNILLSWSTFNTYIPGLRVGVLDAIAILVITALAIALPSAPAGLGLFEAGIVAYLHQRLGVDYEHGLAAATVFHLVITVPQAGLAGIWLWITRSQAAA